MLDKPPSELADRYLHLAEETPKKEALIFERPPLAGLQLTWSDVANRSEDFMREALAKRMEPGARCAVVLADVLDMMPALLALWRLGATAVLIDAAWGSRLRSNVLAHSESNYWLDMSGDGVLTRIRDPDEFTHPLPTGTALLGYTSGSTGDPKAIPFTHQKLAVTMHAASAACTAIRGGAPARFGCSARLSGSGVLDSAYTWAPFVDAAVVVLPEVTIDSARDYWRRIESHDIDQTYLFPSMVELVNQVALPRSRSGTAHLCLTGSAPVSERLQRRFRERFGLPLINCYGISEAMATIFFGNRDKDGNATNEIGVPCLLQARLVDDSGAVINGSGQGELQLSGPTLMDYYYGNQDATRDAFDGRWLRTGDIVRRNAAGIYRIVGRRKHAVMKGGFSIYLSEIEEAASALPDVVEAAAVPLVTDTYEDIGVLVRLLPHSTVTTTDLQQAIITSLGAHRSPRRIIRISKSLPRTGPEKLNRPAIEKLWELETTQGTDAPI